MACPTSDTGEDDPAAMEASPPDMLPDRLVSGYRNFRAGRYDAERERYLRLAEGGQKPRIMMIACCDSRAAPEVIFDASPGELFVVRNVANLVPPYTPDGGHHSTSAALEFAVLSLKVEHVVVMGHGRCGGVAAMVNRSDPLSRGDFIGQWLSAVRDIAEEEADRASAPANERHTAVERAGVEHSLANLRTFPWIRSRESRGDLALHGAWFDIGLGELHVLDQVNHAWSTL
jgi:carbonic anhydrase